MSTPEQILINFKNGTTSLDDAVTALKSSATAQLEHSRLDLDRERRTGAPEVIYGAGKTPDQIIDIATSLLSHGSKVLATRLSNDAAQALCHTFPDAIYSPIAHLVTIVRSTPSPPKETHIAIVSAGTSDQSVAEEAALTAEFLGSTVCRYYDCGVAGLHRIFEELEDIRSARVIVAVAGMEGALPSVIAGLVKTPVIAVPTSVGYGANLGGITTLLAMLNSCSNGVSVVNIDNGFGAGYNAHIINNL